MGFSALQIILVFVWVFIVAIDQFDFLESLYQPIVSGAVIGAILGDLPTGLIVGGTYQLMTIGNMPVGGAQPPNAVIGGVMATVFAISSHLDTTAAVGLAVPFALIGQYMVTFLFTLMSPMMSKADQLAAKGDTKGIVRLNYLAMALLGLLFAIVCTLGMLGGSAMGTTLSNLAAKYAWIMAGLGAAGGMMRFVGFATLLRIMLSNEFWGIYFAGFALATIIGYIPELSGSALLLIAFVVLRSLCMTTRLALLSSRLLVLVLLRMEATTKMASNATHYNNLTPAKPLDKATLNKMVLRSLNLQASFNYERMQAAGWLYCILPGLEKIHADNKEDLELSMEHNLEFFNTHPFLVTFVMGIILSLEQQKADIETIRAVRVAAMGPLGGIGDAIFWFTLVPITAGITSNMAINGSLAGPILFLLIFNIVQFACRFFLMYWSYNLGTKAIDILTANAKEFTRAASMLGVFIVGALTSNYGGTTVATVIENGDSPIVIQSILDGVLPKLIPLALTLGLFFLMKKKNWKPVTCIALLLVIGLVGAFFGIFA